MHMYLTDYIVPSHMESLTGFSQVPSPQAASPHTSPYNLFLLLLTQYSSLKPSKQLKSKFITSPPRKQSQTTASVH